MCILPPIVGECASEGVDDLFIDDTNRIEIETNLRFETAFINFPLEPQPLNTIPLLEDQIAPVETSYGIEQAPLSWIEEINSLIEGIPEYDEVNPYFFGDDGYSFISSPN